MNSELYKNEYLLVTGDSAEKMQVNKNKDLKYVNKTLKYALLETLKKLISIYL